MGLVRAPSCWQASTSMVTVVGYRRIYTLVDPQKVKTNSVEKVAPQKVEQIMSNKWVHIPSYSHKYFQILTSISK